VSQKKPSRGPARGTRTRAVHGSHPERPGPSSTPIVHSATFSFASLDAMNAEQDKRAGGSYYQRVGHPTLRATEERLAAIEGADSALLFSSGVAAIAAVFLSHLKSGDHLLALSQCYGGTHDLLRWGAERFGWTYTMLDARQPATWQREFRPQTRLLHVESPTNPMLVVVDLRQAAALAQEHEALLTVDNTFASPVGQQPLSLGADLVMYSVTKSIGGHSDLLAGAVTGPDARMEAVWKVRKVFGAVPDPALAWQIERSLKTLPLRVAAANENALELARRLAEHPGVAASYYPGLPSHPGHDVALRQMSLGFGPVVSADVRGGALAAEAVVNALQLVRHAPSLGGVDSLACLPAHTSHVQLGVEGRQAAGIPEGLVRFSIGIEDVDDVWADMDQALARAAVMTR
jgi:cystathionine beta-lyase/cystathionine gamma-synthase